jgi:hypothetical protein
MKHEVMVSDSLEGKIYECRKKSWQYNVKNTYKKKSGIKQTRKETMESIQTRGKATDCVSELEIM